LQDPSYYSSLVEAKGGKALYLKFARGVGAAKVVDALTAVQGVPEPVMKDFHDGMLKAIGAQIGKVRHHAHTHRPTARGLTQGHRKNPRGAKGPMQG
jgi:hypothetical protein